jgi:ethanolamine utilization protein EutP
MMSQKVQFTDMPHTAQARPWRFMLIGGIGVGKTTLIRALEEKDTRQIRKTQMIDYSGWGIDIPGEFVEMGHLRRNLTATSFDAQLLVAVQDATRTDVHFPPHYFLMFPQPTIGVITKIDASEANIEQATTLLRQAGVTGEIYSVSAFTGLGISELRAYLLNHHN